MAAFGAPRQPNARCRYGVGGAGRSTSAEAEQHTPEVQGLCTWVYEMGEWPERPDSWYRWPLYAGHRLDDEDRCTGQSFLSAPFRQPQVSWVHTQIHPSGRGQGSSTRLGSGTEPAHSNTAAPPQTPDHVQRWVKEKSEVNEPVAGDTAEPRVTCGAQVGHCEREKRKQQCQ